MGRLEGKALIITGVARGIGKAIAQACAAEGAGLVLIDIDPAVSEVAAGPDTIALCGDVCDVALASKTASFCLSEARLGLIPATIAPYVVRAIGQRHALRYFQTAERFDSAEALRIGLVHAVTAPELLDAKLHEILEALFLASPQATREAKRLVHSVALQPIDDRLLADTAQRIAAARGSDDGREGVRAFLQKRKPRWQMPAPGAAAGGTDGDDEEM